MWRCRDGVLTRTAPGACDDVTGFLVTIPEGGSLAASDAAAAPAGSTEPEAPAEPAAAVAGAPEAEPNDQRSEAVPEEPALEPPFWGSQVLAEEQIDLEEVFAYLDRNALFAGQWQLRKTQQQSRSDYEAMLAEKAEPVLQQWKQRCLAEGLLSPRVAYGFFP